MRFSAKKVIAVPFLAINLSPILWYDLRILSARGMMPPVSIDFLFLIWSAAILPFVIFYLFKISSSQWKHPFIITLIAYISLSLLSGLFEQWPLSSVFGDLFKAGILLSGFGLYWHFRSNGFYILHVIANIMLLFATLRFILFFGLFQDITRLYYGTVYDVIGAIAAMRVAQAKEVVGAYSLPKLRKLRFFYIVILSLLGQKRTAFVGFIMAVTLNLRLRVLLGLLLLVFVASVFSGPFFMEVLANSRMSSLTSFEELQYNEFQRVSEIYAAYELWVFSAKNVLIGAGFGAEIYAYSTELNAFSHVHSVHNTLAGTLVRSGLLGGLVYFMIVIFALRCMFRAHVRKDASIILAVVVCSMFIYTLMDEALIGYFLGRLLNHKEILAQTKRKGVHV